MDAAVAKDKRFAQIAKDPRFHRMKRKDRKVTIDKRFHGMFEDKRFKLKYTVDKRGRPVRTTTNDHLQKYYDLSDEENEEGASDSEGEEQSEAKKEKKKSKKKDAEDESDESESDPDKDDESTTKPSAEKGKAKKKTGGEPEVDSEEEDDENEDSSDKAEGDLARGVGNEETSDSSDESEDGEDEGKDLARGDGNVETSSDESDADESEEEDAFDHKWGELHYTAPPAEEITSRMAVCNMDWDRIKANDIFVLLNSFKPTGGVIKTVSVYPSEFGKERMAEEDIKGPKELVERGPDDDEIEEGSDLQREKMRQYQLNRLRYYYAVVECDSPETANAIYEQCDGIEYESTATRMDLRFIPNDMEFDDEPKTVATCMPDSSTYKPSQFTTTALQQSKVDLTWDETDKDRTAVTMRKFTKEDLEDLDMKDYLASSESEGEDPYANFLEQPDFGQQGEIDESDEAILDQYRDIIKMTKDKGKKKEKKSDVGMEISWDPSLKEDAEKKILKKSSGSETPWEQYLVKKKDKKKKERKKKKSEKDNDKTEEPEKTDKPNKKKSKKVEKTKDVAALEENESEEEEQKEEGDAFSDDDLPSDVDMGDDFFKEEMDQQQAAGQSEKKKRNKKKGTPKDDEEKKKKRAELALLMEDDEEDRNHFNLKDIIEKEGANLSKTKRKKLKKLKKKQEQQGVTVAEDTFKVDVSDPRFDDIFKNPLYNIDPSASEFKSTKATDALIQEKLRRRQQESKLGAAKAKKRQSEGAADGVSAIKQSKKNSNVGDDSNRAHTKDHSLATLVKSVKAKTQTLQQKKRR